MSIWEVWGSTLLFFLGSSTIPVCKLSWVRKFRFWKIPMHWTWQIQILPKIVTLENACVVKSNKISFWWIFFCLESHGGRSDSRFESLRCPFPVRQRFFTYLYTRWTTAFWGLSNLRLEPVRFSSVPSLRFLSHFWLGDYSGHDNFSKYWNLFRFSTLYIFCYALL